MLLGNLVGALALSAPVVQSIPTFGASRGAGVKAGAGFGAGASAGGGAGFGAGASAGGGAGFGAGASAGGHAGAGLGASGGAGVGVEGGAGIRGGAAVGGGVVGGVTAGSSATLIAGFQTCSGLIAGYEVKFKIACQQHDVGVLVSAFGSIQGSIQHLGVDTDAYAHVGADALTTNFVNVFVKLQVLIKLVADYKLTSDCHGAIVDLQASLSGLVSVVKSVGINVSAKLSAAVDLGLFAQIGLDFGFKAGAGIGSGVGGGVGGGVGASIGGGAGAGIGGGVGAGIGGGVGAAFSRGVGAVTDDSAYLVAGFQASAGLIGGYAFKFEKACKQHDIGFLVSALGSIQTSVSGLGADADVYAHVGTDVLTTNVLAVFVKLQVLLRFMANYKLTSSCHAAIVSLQAPLNAIISVVGSIGIDVHAKFSASLDLNLFDQIGLGFSFGAVAGAGAGMGAGISALGTADTLAGLGANAVAGAGFASKAGFNIDASAKVFDEFKASTSVVASYDSSFKTACESKNVAVLNKGLTTIVASISSVGAKHDALAHVTVDALCSQYFELLIKLQVLLKLIASYRLTSSCHDSIISFNSPLKVLLSVLVSAGVDVAVKAQAYGSLDLSFFSSVGVTLGIQASA